MKKKVRELRLKIDAINRRYGRVEKKAIDREKSSEADIERNEIRPKSVAPIVYRRDRPIRSTSSSGQTHDNARWKVALEDALDGYTEVDGPYGPAVCIKNRVEELETGTDLSARFRSSVNTADSGLRACLSQWCGIETAVVHDFMFCDIETTGFAGSPLFLIGMMVWDGEGLEVRQYFARNYAEEAAVISFFAGAGSGRTVLVSFNGKSFDVPFIRERSVCAGVRWEAAEKHLDLLHASRRIWKDKLPNCRLQTLESRICGRERFGDIPGDRISDAYHAFVGTGNAWQMVDVVRHNALDLITLADIMSRMPNN